jgi:hypothetical protein
MPAHSGRSARRFAMAASNSAAFSFVLTVATTPPFQFKSFFNPQHRRMFLVLHLDPAL